MAGAKHHRRRHRNKQQPKTKKTTVKDSPPAAASGPTSVHDFPDHLLELVLLRLHSSACLLRAAAACKRWRRLVVTAPGFLARFFRSSRAPRVAAGHYHAFDPDWVDYGAPPVTGNPVFLPSASSPAVVDARRFALDFLPDSDSGWALADTRGSLLLLFERRTGWAARARSLRSSFPDLLVCEPVTRRCQGILRPDHACCLGVFLLDGGGADHLGIGMSSFRVVAVLHGDHPSEDVFSSGSDGGWRDLPSPSADGGVSVSLPGAIDSVSFIGRSKGSLYWVIAEDGAMLVLDEATLAFSRIPFLADDDIGGSYDRWSFRVIGEDDGGALRVAALTSNELKVLSRRRQGSDDDEWVVEKLVRLAEATSGLPGWKDRFFQRNAMIVAAHEAYVVVTPQEETWLFSVELETMAVEQEHERNRYAGQAYPCELPWPPAGLEAACADRGSRRRSSRR